MNKGWTQQQTCSSRELHACIAYRRVPGCHPFSMRGKRTVASDKSCVALWTSSKPDCRHCCSARGASLPATDGSLVQALLPNPHANQISPVTQHTGSTRLHCYVALLTTLPQHPVVTALTVRAVTALLPSFVRQGSLLLIHIPDAFCPRHHCSVHRSQHAIGCSTGLQTCS
jgi:hypothetical protein